MTRRSASLRSTSTIFAAFTTTCWWGRPELTIARTAATVSSMVSASTRSPNSSTVGRAVVVGIVATAASGIGSGPGEVGATRPCLEHPPEVIRTAGAVDLEERAGTLHGTPDDPRARDVGRQHRAVPRPLPPDGAVGEARLALDQVEPQLVVSPRPRQAAHGRGRVGVVAGERAELEHRHRRHR